MSAALTHLQDHLQTLYHQNQRQLPWRPPLLQPNKDNHLNPYKILISEVMLQQTQAVRVITKYNEFITRFPTITNLTSASTKEVLLVWQGLGYNRRGLWLHQAATTIENKFNSVIPNDPQILNELKGIGPYTAKAIATFAFNQPHLFLETNIRAVLIHHFFKDSKTPVSDDKLFPWLEKLVDKKEPRLFYYALFDYGAELKAAGLGKPAKSAGYTKQSKFIGSNRSERSRLLKSLLQSPRPKEDLIKHGRSPDSVSKNLNQMQREGLIRLHNDYWQVVE
jgi:A/G-specific adenine glycosylase